MYNGGMIKHFYNLSHALAFVDEDEVQKAVDILHEVKKRNSTVFIAGNGGSAATASHFANDLTKIAGIKAFALTDMTPTMMAYGNDDGWENMFSHMLDGLMQEDDALVAISCSGTSMNVVNAAKDVENLIVLTGNDEKNNYLARYKPKSFIMAPDPDITIQEDIHLAVCHAIAKVLRD